MELLKDFVRDETGATAIEYGLIAALIAVGIIAGASSMGGSINNLFGDTDGELQNVFN